MNNYTTYGKTAEVGKGDLILTDLCPYFANLTIAISKITLLVPILKKLSNCEERSAFHCFNVAVNELPLACQIDH
ncbi:hypothetical protein GWI33_015257 [Rhynchophorus ferrugineus]|uniref:Uncharacterized protein n=1 Tax=Rhynchophorus ferrugineus TaxID=354439 RepID=A0A834I5Q9_RHYFE|nr:hypothetical protein GWI33_015257 [Rhynchophorus ferrugineus]